MPFTNGNKVMCNACKKYFKGRRGLNIHLGRSPNCKNALQYHTPQCASTNCASEITQIPHEVKEAIKSPSTTVEDLEHKCGDGKNTKIKFHNSKHGCKMCYVLSTKDHFVSSSTHRIYKSVIPSSISHIDCNTSNIIYLITCKKCALQYVGETCQKLRERFNHHNSCIMNPAKDHNCRILSEHFSKGSCKGATYTVKIIEKLKGDGRDSNGDVDTSVTAIRRKKETAWMLKLRTVFPYGLNDRIGNEHMADKGNSIICNQFPPLKRYNKHTRARTKRKVSHSLLVDHFPYIIMESIKSNRRNTINLIRVLLANLPKSCYRKMGDTINDFLLSKNDNFLFSHYFLAALDIISSHTWKPLSINKPKQLSKYRCKINFSNKGIDFVNLPRILNSSEIMKLLPPFFNNKSPMVVFDLIKPIRSKIFNYKKTVQHLEVDNFLANPSILPCTCTDSPFLDVHHGHIITGDLKLVRNNKLRKLLIKGPKFRESEGICWNTVRDSIRKGIMESVDKWADSKGVHRSLFTEWRNKVFEIVDCKISTLKRQVHPRGMKKALSDNDVINYLKELQDKFVIVPVDKADSNVAFICKRYYAEVLIKELGLGGNTTKTYEHLSNANVNDIITHHRKCLFDEFRLNTSKEMQTLPDIYWLPKLHKTPTKARFIIASQKCTVKRLSKDITSIFKLAHEQIYRYNQKASTFSGIKTFWVIKNSRPVLNALNRISNKKNAKTISSFDFSTLYTNIPHSKLFHELSAIIKFIFKGGSKMCISVDKQGIAHWTTRVSNSSSSYDLDKILKAVEYLLNNCHFKFGDKLFRQVVGIPMGSDPAPYFANLFLYRYESRWLNKMKKENNVLARKFGGMFRYIDDLLAVNDGGEFEKHCSEIYPEELELKKENIVNTKTSFLELDIHISEHAFHTKLYDKRDAFGFSICRMPFKNSNLPGKMFYSSACAEILRICRATSSLEDTLVLTKSLINRMFHQGAILSSLKLSLMKSLNKHQTLLDKFNITTQDMVNNLIFKLYLYPAFEFFFLFFFFVSYLLFYVHIYIFHYIMIYLC